VDWHLTEVVEIGDSLEKLPERRPLSRSQAAKEVRVVPIGERRQPRNQSPSAPRERQPLNAVVD